MMQRKKYTGFIIFAFKNVNNIEISNIQMQEGAGDALLIADSKNIKLKALKIQNFSKNAIVANNVENFLVDHCEIGFLGRSCMEILAGDRTTLKSGKVEIKNSLFHHSGRIDRTYTPGINNVGVGSHIHHNEFYNIPSSAMRVDGNDHLVEHNYFHNCVEESDDQGAIDMWGDPTYRGNVYRYNYFKDIVSKYSNGNSIAGKAGIRLDDTISGVEIYGNLFENCSFSHFGAVQIHGGKENQIYNNIFLNNKAGVSFSLWNRSFWHSYLNKRGVLKLLDDPKVKALYEERYPLVKNLHRKLMRNEVFNNLYFNVDEKYLRRDLRIKVSGDSPVHSFNGGYNEIKENSKVKEMKFSYFNPIN